jgi:3-hydroxyacyl-[acyl-carrier-protein] dehydratase
MRWIWIDRFLEFERGKRARAVKNLSRAEDIFTDHFPGYPVMPGSLILEGLAQTGGILVGEANDFREKVVLAKITSARFHREALAGQRLVFDTEILVLRPEGASIRGRVFVADTASRNGAEQGHDPGPLLAEAEIFFAHLDQSRSQQVFGEHNFVFSGELQHLLRLAQSAAQEKGKMDRVQA